MLIGFVTLTVKSLAWTGRRFQYPPLPTLPLVLTFPANCEQPTVDDPRESSFPDSLRTRKIIEPFDRF